MMQFNSIAFLIAFAVFLVIYAFCPERWRRYLMLAGSVAFVAVNSWQAALFALLFAAVNYVLGFCVSRTAFRKPALACAAAVNVIALVTFKQLGVPMLGLSYYLFSFIAYLADVARGTIEAETDPIRFASFTFFFPKYIQGPIARYGELSGQLDRPKYALANVQLGLTYFILGFAMKILLSDKLSVMWSNGYYSLARIGYDAISTKLAWLGAVDTSLQIFIDWQAYTFMAMGIAGTLGYKLPQNFNYPYIARTVSDYYRRWHMTLTRWFTDYVYIPLGGSREGLLRTILNVLLVWLLTSVWHGSGLAPKYLFWGVAFAAAVLVDPVWNRRINGRSLETDPEGRPTLASRLVGHIWLVLLIPVTVVVLWKPAPGLNFILWGMTVGVCAVIERLWRTFVVNRFQIGKRMEDHGVLGKVWKVFVSILAHIWVLIPIIVSWVMFTIRDLDDLALYLSRLFPASGKSAGMDPNDFATFWKSVGPAIIVGVVLCFPLPETIIRRVGKSKIGSWVLSVLLAALFWYSVYVLTQNGSDPMGYAAF